LYKKKHFLLPKTKAISAKNHFYKKINFLKKNKTVKVVLPKPNPRKNPLIFMKKKKLCLKESQYISKLVTTQLL